MIGICSMKPHADSFAASTQLQARQIAYRIQLSSAETKLKHDIAGVKEMM